MPFFLKLHNLLFFPATKDLFFFSPAERSYLSSRYCFGKIRVFSRIKKRRRKIGVYNLNFENIGGETARCEYYAEAEISFQRRFLFFGGGGGLRKKKEEERKTISFD